MTTITVMPGQQIVVIRTCSIARGQKKNNNNS